jgi:hypothetical protein
MMTICKEIFPGIKTYKNMAILFIFSGFVIMNVKAQIPLKISNQQPENLKSSKIGKADLASGSFNTSVYNLPVDLKFTSTDMIRKPGFIFDNTGKGYYDLNSRSALFVSSVPWLTPKLLSVDGYETIGTSYFNRKKLTGNALIDKAGFYAYPLKDIKEPTLYDNRLYRFAGSVATIILESRNPGAYNKSNNLPDYFDSRLYRFAGFIVPEILEFSYPGAGKTVNYPPPYLQPRYSAKENSQPISKKSRKTNNHK